MKNMKKNNHGFTLIELAIVLVIIGVLLGSFLSTFGARIDNTRRAETLDELEVVKQAILGYVYAKSTVDGPYLPCPDCRTFVCQGGTAANDGKEDRKTLVAELGRCSVENNVGNLPWITLGLAAGDGWDNRYKYWVDPMFSRTGQGGAVPWDERFDLGDGAAGTVNTRVSGVTGALANNVVAVIYSLGKNSLGGVSVYNVAQPNIPAANLDERENADADGLFVSRPPTEAGATGGEFDDIVVWISEYELKAKLVEAGVLP